MQKPVEKIKTIIIRGWNNFIEILNLDRKRIKDKIMAREVAEIVAICQSSIFIIFYYIFYIDYNAEYSSLLKISVAGYIQSEDYDKT